MRQRNRGGFTIVEIITVVAVFGILFSLVIVDVLLPALRRADAVANIQQLRNVRIALQAYDADRRYSIPLPVTGGTDVPVVGSASVALRLRLLATLDLFLGATGHLRAPLQWRNAQPVHPARSYGIVYDISQQAFTHQGPGSLPSMSAAMTAARSYSHIGAKVSNWTRPSLAQGANFQLSAGVSMPSNAVVVYAVLPRVPDALARTMAEQLLPADRVPDLGARCDFGPIAYDRSSSGITTVYLYVTHR